MTSPREGPILGDRCEGEPTRTTVRMGLPEAGRALVRLQSEFATRVRNRLHSSMPPVRASLAILDDVFPNLLTAFRVTEFNAYMDEWPGVRIATSASWFPTVSGARGFNASLREYAAVFPANAAQIGPLRHDRRLHASLGYCVFLNNAET